jgi:pyruvate/2-oxoglutarate dehydrogenase complex dihydrolipoamide acyltransferase (E2) component
VFQAQSGLRSCKSLIIIDQILPDCEIPMATKVNFPKAGMGIEEGTVKQWLKSVGDQVAKGDVLVEIETAKAIQEVEAPVGGTLTEILLPEGETAAVNTAIAMIEEDHA